MASHVTKCEDAGAIERWNKSLKEAEAWLAKLHMYPMLVSLLISHLTEWKTRTRKSPLHASYPDICELQEAHDEIGWYEMVVRNISILWREIPEQYYHGLKQRYSSLHWMNMLIQEL
jgi:hypothetical protein